MLKLKKIAVTGSLASGKSTVGRYLKKQGAYVVDSDKIIHLILSRIEKERLERLFKRRLNKKARAEIAKVVFQDRKKLKKLERLIHPLLLEEITRRYEEAKKGGYKLFVVEMPLLFELGLEKNYDIIITVTAKKALRKKRFKKSFFEKRDRLQMGISKKIKKSDFVVKNNETLKNLKKHLCKLLSKEIISKWTRTK